MKLGQTDIYWGSRLSDTPREKTLITWGHPPMPTQRDARGEVVKAPDGPDLDATLDALIVVPLAIVSGLALLVAWFVGLALLVGLFLRIVLSVL